MHKFKKAVQEYEALHNKLINLPGSDPNQDQMIKLAECAGCVVDCYLECVEEVRGHAQRGDRYLSLAYLTAKKCHVMSSFKKMTKQHGLPTPSEGRHNHHGEKNGEDHDASHTSTRKNDGHDAPQRRPQPAMFPTNDDILDHEVPFWGESSGEGWWAAAQGKAGQDPVQMSNGDYSLNLDGLHGEGQTGGDWSHNQTSVPKVMVELWIKSDCPDCQRHVPALKNMLSDAAAVDTGRYVFNWGVKDEAKHHHDHELQTLKTIPRFPALVVKIEKNGRMMIAGKPISGNQDIEQVKRQFKAQVEPLLYG